MGFPLEPEEKRPTLHPAVPCICALLLGAVALGLFIVRSLFSPNAPQLLQATPVASTTHVSTPHNSFSQDDLTVELDRQGRARYKGDIRSLEEIKPHVSRAMSHLSPNGVAVIQAEEGCPYKFVQQAVQMYKDLGVSDPTMTTLPPRRTVEVRLDATGKVTVDGRSVGNPQEELRQIVLKHGSRAAVTIYADPKCPAESVISLVHFCKQVSFGRVIVESASAEAEAPH